MYHTDNHAAAQAVHDLGSALWFGGATMGAVGVNRSGADLAHGIDRVRVARSAWTRYAPLQWTGVAATVVAGLQLTRTSTRRLMLQKSFGTVGTVKAGVTLAGAVATVYSAYCGMRISRLAEDAHDRGDKIEVTDAVTPASGTPEEIAMWQRRQQVVQYVVPVLVGASIACNSYLMESFRPMASARGVLRRMMSV